MTVSAPIWKHRLFSCDWNLYPPTAKYSLKELITKQSDWNSDSEALCSWLIERYNSSLSNGDVELCPVDDSSRYKSVKEINALFIQGPTYYLLDRQKYSPLLNLRPFISSLMIFPDVGIVCKPFIVLHCEINSSSPMTNTVAKLAANLTDELRFERHYDPNISKIVGFAFPNSCTKEYVCSVTVEFRNLTFYVTCRTFELADPAITSEVNQAIKDHLKLATDLYEKPMNPYTLVRFSETDIDLLCKSIAAMGQVQVEGSLKQVDSQYCLVFHDDKKYYKYCPDITECLSLFTFLGESSNRLVFPQHILHVEIDEAAPFPFFIFPKQRFQLTSLRISQLKSCLFNLASGIKDALEELHGTYEYAHLDVRLANVCFDDGHVKLIDFDRCQHTSVKDVASKYNNHYMYTYSAGVVNPNASLLDWKQLGLLIYSILKVSKQDADLKSDDFSRMQEDTQSLVYSLVYNHMWDDNCANSLCRDKTVEQCFQDQLPPAGQESHHSNHGMFCRHSCLTLFIPDNSTIVAPRTILKCMILMLYIIIVCFKHHRMYVVHKCQVYPIGLNFLACTYVQ